MTTVILGGGIVGVTTAYYLAREGRDVVVIDRQGGVARETSFANAGLVAPGHAYTWASPKAPKILLKSLFMEGQALRLKPDMAEAAINLGTALEASGKTEAALGAWRGRLGRAAVADRTGARALRDRHSDCGRGRRRCACAPGGAATRRA